MAPPQGIPAKVTKIQGRQAFVVPQADSPANISKGGWFRVLCASIGDEGLLIPPRAGARFQDWLFAPTHLNPHWNTKGT